MTNRESAGGRDWRSCGPPAPASEWHNVRPSRSPSSVSLKGCCCCLFLLLIFLLLLAVAVALIIVLAVRPKKPEFDLQRVGVEYLLVAPEDTVGSDGAPPAAAYISLNITLLFTAVNPNKVEIKYGDAAFYVLYHGVPLGIAEVPGFEQPAHSTRLVETKVSVSHFNVLQADASQLVRDAAVDDRVELRITGDVGAKIRFLGLTSPRVQVSSCSVHTHSLNPAPPLLSCAFSP
ncbi:hypothetical protein AXF42_Ash017037 [Apostasia shenzhenica]|uniref:Late embryogenesis abundant protein LEA-2 subgroup domain-containing protein n=1 Tax=Apostasia shenzhenica TaxID=1088818 RepID=A0A2I0B7H6_9ASPA|nr:hypothetical protein AXF42_Ash017037 [Apostasia shenzhenica]